ncbi:MAG: hypothetical protein WCT40_03810 [Candidatus Magasanikbacteria bacterium]|jgi:hypothetical protein
MVVARVEVEWVQTPGSGVTGVRGADIIVVAVTGLSAFALSAVATVVDRAGVAVVATGPIHGVPNATMFRCGTGSEDALTHFVYAIFGEITLPVWVIVTISVGSAVIKSKLVVVVANFGWSGIAEPVFAGVAHGAKTSVVACGAIVWVEAKALHALLVRAGVAVVGADHRVGDAVPLAVAMVAYGARVAVVASLPAFFRGIGARTRFGVAHANGVALAHRRAYHIGAPVNDFFLGLVGFGIIVAVFGVVIRRFERRLVFGRDDCRPVPIFRSNRRRVAVVEGIGRLDPETPDQRHQRRDHRDPQTHVLHGRFLSREFSVSVYRFQFSNCISNRLILSS